MKIGTKSLLFGIHQVFWHPYVVYRAWRYLYGRPTWKEFVCIVIHDLGYWKKLNLDGEEGIEHPKYGADLAFKLFGDPYWELCAGHSRSYIKLVNERFGYVKYHESKLCWADKLSFCFEPWWFYYIRSKLSGEINELYIECELSGLITHRTIFREWYKVMTKYIKDIPEIQKLLSSSEVLARNKKLI